MASEEKEPHAITRQLKTLARDRPFRLNLYRAKRHRGKCSKGVLERTRADIHTPKRRSMASSTAKAWPYRKRVAARPALRAVPRQPEWAPCQENGFVIFDPRPPRGVRNGTATPA